MTRLAAAIVPGVAGIMAGLALDSSGEAAGERRDLVQTFLADEFQFDAADFHELERRRAVARTLDAADGREVATLGGIQLRVPPDFYVAQLRNIEGFKRSAAVPQIGRFGSPARPEDLAALTLESSDVDGLRRCQPEDCRVQLSAEAIARFQREVPWGTAGDADAANRVMREVLADLVNRYRASGDAALMTYADTERPLSIAAEFRSLVRARPAVLDRFPRLFGHLLGFPQARDARVEDFVYWSKEKMGPATIVTVTHLAIATLEDGDPVAYAIASKQIYGSHYFDASLGLTLLLRDGQGRPASAALLYVNRTRLDVLGGFWGALKRTIVRSRTRSAMSSSLVEARDLVERRFQTHASGGAR